MISSPGRMPIRLTAPIATVSTAKRRASVTHESDAPESDWQPIVIDVGEDIDPIPPRAWLLGNSFCREFVSSVFAGGGTGKTALRVAQLLSLASGQPLTGEHVFRRSRDMMIGLEDGIDELRRRVRAAMMYYGVKAEDVRGRFYIVHLPPANSKLILESGGEIFLRAWLEKQIVEKDLALVCLDPLIKLHDMPENDNAAMERVIEVLVEFAITHKMWSIPHTTCARAQTSRVMQMRGGAGARLRTAGASSIRSPRCRIRKPSSTTSHPIGDGALSGTPPARSTSHRATRPSGLSSSASSSTTPLNFIPTVTKSRWRVCGPHPRPGPT